MFCWRRNEQNHCNLSVFLFMFSAFQIVAIVFSVKILRRKDEDDDDDPEIY